jgi:hypothetical protein
MVKRVEEHFANRLVQTDSTTTSLKVLRVTTGDRYLGMSVSLAVESKIG